MQNFERFRLLRETIGVTQSEFAKTMGFAPSFISGIERNKKDVSRDLLQKLLEKYQININWLLSGEGEMFLSSLPATITETAVTKNDRSFKVPLLRQKVSCGSGIDWQTEENIERTLDVFSLIPRLGGGKLYAFKASGSSMLGAGIRNGDYLIFDSNPDQYFSDGVYIFSMDGELYCKRLEFDGISGRIKIFSVRVADLEKAELLRTIETTDTTQPEGFTIFGKVRCLMRPMGED